MSFRVIRTDNIEAEIDKAELIIKAVCNHFKMERWQINLKSRKPEVTIPRFVCMYLIYHNTQLGLKRIGRLFYDMDHTTVLHAKNHVQEQVYAKHPNEYKEAVQALEEKIAA